MSEDYGNLVLRKLLGMQVQHFDMPVAPEGCTLVWIDEQQDWGMVRMTGSPSSGIPSTARAIMDLVPEKKTPPLTEKQQAAAEGVARAVQNLSRRDTAFMPCAAEWVA